MRKLFSLIAAVLFAGSMMAAEVTITPDNCGWTATAGAQSGVVEGVTVANTNGLAGVDASTGVAAMRIYKNATLTISAESNIVKIEFTCAENGTTKFGPGCFAAQEGYTFEAEGPKGTWVGSANQVEFVASGNQVRATQIVVTLEGGDEPAELSFNFKVDQEGITITPSNNDPWAGMALPTAVITEEFGTIEDLVAAVKDMMEPIQGKYTLKFEDLDPEEFPAGTECTFVAWGLVDGAATTIGSTEFVVPAPLTDPTNCAEAAAAALSVEKNNELYNGGKEYTIEGYVTEIATAYNDQYHNITFWMADEKDGGQVLEAYRAACSAEADAPAVGDKVKVTGKLTKYNTTPEFAAGCTFVITEKAEPVVEDGWAKILFTEPVAAADLAAEAEFALLGSDFKVKIADPDNKMSIDANACRFGSAEEYVMYSYRLKTGGKTTGEKNFITATIPADGILRLAVRTGSNSDTTRTLIVAQGADTLYNQVIRESMAVKVMEGETEVSVYPYVEIAVKAGAVALSYPVNGLNFYLFAFTEEAPALKDPTNCAEAAEAALSVEKDNELYNGGKEYTIEGYVTEIQTAWSSQYNNISFWMADEKDGGKVLEAYRAACASEADAPKVGDKVAVTGSLTKYGTTPEFAAGCTYEIIERAPEVVPQNLGEKTIAEFLELKNKIDTCILTGAIDSVVNTLFGNFYLKDATATVYVYGLLNAAGEAKKCFEEEGLQVGDIITIKAIYSEYNNNPQVKDAIFVRKKGQGIDNTNVEIKVEKFFRDGQLIIRKNGIEYNVQGAVIK